MINLVWSSGGQGRFTKTIHFIRFINIIYKVSNISSANFSPVL